MGLRLPWEITEKNLLCFETVVVLPRTRQFSYLAGESRALTIDNSVAETAASGEGHVTGSVSNSLFAKLGVKKTNKDFLDGISALQEQDLHLAAHSFRRALTKDEKMSDALFALVCCGESAEEQLEAVDRALLAQNNFTQLYKKYGIQLCATFSACDGQQIRIQSDLPGLEILGAEIYQRHGKTDSAQRVLEQSPHRDLDIFRFSRGESLYQLHRYEEAIDLLRRVNHNPALAGPAAYLLGLCLEQLGYISTAVQVYRNCLKTITVSSRLEVAMRSRLVKLLEQEEKKWMAEREQQRLSELQKELADEKGTDLD